MFERRKIGEILLDMGATGPAEIEAALKEQKSRGVRIGEALLDVQAIRPSELARALSIQADVDYLEEIDLEEINLDLLDDIPINYARGRKILPLQRVGSAVRVAVADPFDMVGIDQVATALRARVEPYVVAEQQLVDALNVAYDRHDRLKGSYGRLLDDEKDESESDEEPGFDEVVDLLGAGDDDEAPVIQFVNTTFVRAVRDRASDIHIEPHESRVGVRFRIDGVLQEVAEVQKRFHSSIAARIKIMAGLNIAEKRLPQDGRIRIKLAGKDIDIRVATVPLAHGERITMRLLDKSQVLLDLKSIGMDDMTLEHVEELIHRPYGIILVTGPTGSGKTTTLYSCLSRINTADRNILTIEDPVEYQLEGISQVAVQKKIDLTFANGLRSFLRHDPDVIMVGEIRDGETAEIAIQASLTGHLVFSTVHTNDAAGAFTRLIDMGVEPFLVSSSLIAVMAQRLVRRLCPDCKEPYRPTEEQIRKLEVSPDDVDREGGIFYRPVGCEKCSELGYRGRTGIYELLLVSDEIRSLVMKHSDAGAIKRKALEQGMSTLRMDGARKVLAGSTSLEEVLRVTQSEVVSR
jgi:general secretion pathway protein E